MAFNVLKDPKDPRNFIVTPVPQGGLDPNLIAAGGRSQSHARQTGARGHACNT